MRAQQQQQRPRRLWTALASLCIASLIGCQTLTYVDRSKISDGGAESDGGIGGQGGAGGEQGEQGGGGAGGGGGK